MKDKILEHIEVLVTRYPVLEASKAEIIAAYQIIEKSYKNGGKLLVAGNGGSAADAEHIVGIKVPQTETYMIQELHLPVYHCLCLMLEDEFFGEN